MRITVGKVDRCFPMLGVKGIDENAEKPGAHIGARFKFVEATPGKQERFLHQIFRGKGIARQPDCKTKQTAGMRHGYTFEFANRRPHSSRL